MDLDSCGWFWGGSGVTLDGSEGGSVWIYRVLGGSGVLLEWFWDCPGLVLGWFWECPGVVLGCFWGGSGLFQVVLYGSGVVLGWF
jgi:hypothetical protein